MIRILSLILLTTQLIDHNMTEKEKKKTGLIKLNNKEKRSLEEWINKQYAKKDAPVADATPETPPLLQENLNDGHYIRLSDNSLWEINPQDTILTQSWIVPAQIIVIKKGTTEYPYTLKNSLTGSSVRARKVSDNNIKQK